MLRHPHKPPPQGISNRNDCRTYNRRIPQKFVKVEENEPRKADFKAFLPSHRHPPGPFLSHLMANAG